jgi:hypothetical protein
LDNFERAKEALWDGAEEWHQEARDIATDILMDKLAKGDSETLEQVMDRMMDKNVFTKFLTVYAMSVLEATDQLCSDVSGVLDEYRDWLIDNDLIQVD